MPYSVKGVESQLVGTSFPSDRVKLVHCGTRTPKSNSIKSSLRDSTLQFFIRNIPAPTNRRKVDAGHRGLDVGVGDRADALRRPRQPRPRRPRAQRRLRRRRRGAHLGLRQLRHDPWIPRGTKTQRTSWLM